MSAPGPGRSQPTRPAVAAPEHPPKRHRWLVAAAVAMLLGVHFTLAVGSKRHESTTSDELVHVTAGYSYWVHNDYRLQPENGNLPQRWAALPTALTGATFPRLDSDDWRTSQVWRIGHDFFYGTGEDHFPRLMAGRAMIALFSVATGLLVFLWSRSLFGNDGGLLSLTLFAFSPMFLAHGALATSDVCMTFFFLASVGAYWRHLHDGRLRMLTLSAAVFGLACVAKFSAVLLIPMFGLLALARVFEPEPFAFRSIRASGRVAKCGALAFSGAVHAAAALLVIWAFYGFRYSAANPALPGMTQFIFPWQDVISRTGIQGLVVQLCANLRLLPESFLYGYAYVIDSATARAAFLNGEHRMTGWPTFFGWTFLLKTTIPVMLASALIAWLALRRWVADRKRLVYDGLRVLPLVVLFVVYLAFSVTSHLNIGHRHIMPTYPVLFIAAGAIALAAIRLRSRFLLGTVVILPCWQAAEAARTYPHYIAYFNPIGGGPAQGYRHLVDSSLDWGQDLPALKDWLTQNAKPTTPVFIAYFGNGSPEYYGLHANRLVTLSIWGQRQPFAPLAAGWYCLSATALQNVYNPARGPWKIEYERAFQQLKPLEPVLADVAANPARLAEWNKALPKTDWALMQRDYEQLRFARLCHLLRLREPNAEAGYSILIYRVSQADIDAVQGNFDTWSNAIKAELENRSRRK